MESEPIYPKRRADNVVVTCLDDEVLIQDTVSHEAHGLNAMASCIWYLCDGTTSVPDMAGRASEELGEPVDESVIWYTLSVFQRKHLLAEKVVTKDTRVSRKRAVTKIGIAAGLAAVASITIPDAMAHASVCRHTGFVCGGTAPACCAGCSCKSGLVTAFGTHSLCIGIC